MKKKLFILLSLIILSSISVYGSNIDKSYTRSEVTNMNGVIYDSKTNKKLNGTLKLYLESGALDGTLEYKNGIKDGDGFRYYSTGIVKTQSEFKNGELHGQSMDYFENGSVGSLENYVKGKLNKISVAYYPDGKLKTKSNFKNGARDGISSMYDKQGVLLESRLYENDKLVRRLYHSYAQTGNIEKDTYMKDGLRYDKDFNYPITGMFLIFFKDTGRINKAMEYTDGRKNGRYVEYSKDKTKIKDVIYKEGILQN